MRTAAGWAVALVTILLVLAIPLSFVWSVSYVARSRFLGVATGMIVHSVSVYSPFGGSRLPMGLEVSGAGNVGFSVLPRFFDVGTQPVTHVVPVHMVALPLALLAWFLLRPALRARRRRSRGCCSECGYDLTGNESGVCPECGQATSDAPA